MIILIPALLVLSALYWAFVALQLLRAMRQVPQLAELQPPPPPRWPRLSLVIPACDEEATLEPALRSRLREDYPELELVVIDDRSTDATGAIVDRVAAEDARVRALHIRSLPEGWLGKVHALHRGVEQASGEWLLFTDADVHLEPGTLRTAVAYCESRGLDHLGVFPEVWSASFRLDVALGTFGRLVALAARPHAVEDPRSRAAFGVGAFNLVRRSALERSPGLSWLRLELLDDAALGQMLKRSGARCGMAMGRGRVGLTFYPSLRELARGTEKNGFAGAGRFSQLRLVLFCLTLLALEGTPFAALLAFGHPLVQLAGGAIAALAVGASMVGSRWMARPVLPNLLLPLGTLFFVGCLLRSGYLAHRRGGIAWRGTLYPTALLRAGARYEFP
ncbi:glycosyltransferase [Aggregicoccus sp. 17bor-14]|uniref:glycosyltransferase n=1 Tax=Myxococcaceae TaxID=31 RepID=UPI00129C59F4|nr:MULTISPECIES: glycosyltransferase family 2 protein [Myxococcaceae]MBF5041107.1 glycosyltransferase [Simulacricoccus sp. 17bor-14]MRI86894.1 glycosyltransferase [Aggregicoccus sp. 17bor-14]